MKNAKGFIIIGLSIIIGSLIISFTISNKNYSAKEHCYKRTYASDLERNKSNNKLRSDETKLTNKQMEASAARSALSRCRIK